jgi:hypothetical protein
MSKCQTKRHATLEENEIGVDMIGQWKIRLGCWVWCKVGEFVTLEEKQTLLHIG